MRMFRKKPIVIEAVQWNGNWAELLEFCTVPDSVGGVSARYVTGDTENLNQDGRMPVIIHTLEGGMRAELGDWIIKGVNGEFYPCKPDIFAQTYDDVDPLSYEVIRKGAGKPPAIAYHSSSA